MTPTNQQLLDLIKILGDHVMKMDEMVLALSQGQESQSKLRAARLPTLTAKERQLLTALSSRSESSLEHLEAALKNFRENFASCPFWK